MDAKTLCLGALMRGQYSGYEIRKMFEDGPYSAIHGMGFGSIYPALTALLNDGLVTVQEQSQDGKPDKKVYSITPAGRAKFMDSLQSDPSTDKLRSDMLFMLSFGDLMGPDRVRALLNKYVAHFKHRLEEMGSGCPRECDSANPAHAFVHGFGETLYKTAIGYIEENRAMLEHSSDDDAGVPAAAAGGY